MGDVVVVVVVVVVLYLYPVDGLVLPSHHLHIRIDEPTYFLFSSHPTHIVNAYFQIRINSECRHS